MDVTFQIRPFISHQKIPNDLISTVQISLEILLDLKSVDLIPMLIVFVVQYKLNFSGKETVSYRGRDYTRADDGCSFS
jgi:hypothetical protein